ncbi:MAG: TIGR03663 family protein [Phycisphaerae bacterium]|nr:TIGR03663 family protein [Phycisphaerae bacterium]
MTATKKRILFGALILAVTAGALAMRLDELARRPMHTDEAVHTEKFRELYEEGFYRYNPHEFHGPTLNYLTLPVVWLSRPITYAETTETHYRIVPVIFGVLLVALLWGIGDGIGRVAAVCAGVLTAISPAMVFYSRYYIQEMLLVAFTFGAIVAGWRYARSRHLGWALLCGACIGLMYATKETCIIAYAAMAAALLVAKVVTKVTGPGRDNREFGRIKASHVLCGAGVACLVSVVFFSSFFTNASGPLDSLRFLAAYFHRAGGEGFSGLHKHPWHFYLRMLTFYRDAPGPWWSEGLILLLAVCGIVAAITRKGLGDASVAFSRFVAVYSAFMVVAYSAIPYKTPWCMLGFLHGLILLAGLGAAAIVRWLPKAPLKVLVVVLLLAGGLQLARQGRRANCRFCADWRNPYVYAQTSRDLLRLAKRAHQMAAIHPDGYDMRINIIAAEADYWPLPWYLRRFNQGRIGYWREPPEDADAPMVVAGVSHGTAAGVEAKLRDKYQTEYYGLRPNVLLRVYIRRDLWRTFLDHLRRAQPK